MPEIDQMHVNHFDRKVGTPATYLAMGLMGQPKPTISGYRQLDSMRRAGLDVLRKQFRRNRSPRSPWRQPGARDLRA